MAYASPDHMVALFKERTLVQLTEQDEWNDAARERVSWALESFSAVIDGYLATIFAASGATTLPPLITDICCYGAFYRLHEDPPAKVAADYKDALRQLAEIRDGKIKIDEGNVDAISARPGAVLLDDPGRVFSRDSMRGY